MPVGLIQPDWGRGGRIVAGTTTRAGGVSEAPFDTLNLGERCGDAPDAVAANRERLAEHLGMNCTFARQVHGTRAIEVASASEYTEADAFYTDRPGQICAILTADCLPVLLCSSDEAWVAAVHAGWRGLAAGVIEAAVRRCPRPESLRAWLGPAISQANFEVGADVLAAFTTDRPVDRDCFAPNARGRWQADLVKLARRRLQALGVADVTDSGLCTVADDRFYSYRRDGRTGRMASFIAIRER